MQGNPFQLTLVYSCSINQVLFAFDRERSQRQQQPLTNRTLVPTQQPGTWSTVNHCNSHPKSFLDFKNSPIGSNQTPSKTASHRTNLTYIPARALSTTCTLSFVFFHLYSYTFVIAQGRTIKRAPMTSKGLSSLNPRVGSLLPKGLVGMKQSQTSPTSTTVSTP